MRFPSDYPLSESVARLRARTERSVFSSLFHESAVGPVTETRVRLQHMMPFSRNIKPIFVGTFRQHHGRVVLEGRFTVFPFSKVVMTMWLAGALAWTIAAALVVGTGDAAFLVPLTGLALLVVGIVVIRACWWLSRNDVPFLVAVIQEALSERTSP
jgi:hypothetical protein